MVPQAKLYHRWRNRKLAIGSPAAADRGRQVIAIMP